MSDVPRLPQRRATDPPQVADATKAMAREIAGLKRDLAQVRSEFNDTHAAKLLEANERLVVSALNAESDAEMATSKLGELTRATQRDPLTNTPNRPTMLDRMQSAIGMAHRHASRFAVIFIDVDDFKAINDTYGHPVGDEMLHLIARRLESATRTSDTVSRHGGDEFLVLLAEISDPSDVLLIASKMLASLAQPVEGYPLHLSASIGAAIYPDHGEDTATLVINADAAMYAAKGKGGGCVEFFAGATAHGSGQAAELPTSPRPRSDSDGPEGVKRQMRNLREANQRLIVTSMAAQESEAACLEVRRRHEKFLSMVAHELRNPLMPIRTSATMMTSVHGDEHALRRLQSVIQRQVNYMGRIVDDLLDRSRATEGKFRIEMEVVDLASVFDTAVQTCRTAIEARLQSLDMHFPNTKLIVDGDALRLAQIFSNLLDNASKYTNNGGTITLTVEVNGPDIVCVVADDGIGIEASMLPRIFDLFVQDPRAVAVHNAGLGIGLAIVKDLVEAHGGTVAASSQGHNLGSEFSVVLPRSSGEPLPGE